MAVVETSLHFLTRDKLYEHEKPYQLKYTAAEGIPTTNIRLEKKDSIKISSMRGQERRLSFENNGFTVLKMDNEIPYDTFSNSTSIQKYLDMVAEQLKTRLGADKVQVYQYTVCLQQSCVLVNRNVTLTIPRSENVIQISPPKRKEKSTSSLSHRRLLISVSNLLTKSHTRRFMWLCPCGCKT